MAMEAVSMGAEGGAGQPPCESVENHHHHHRDGFVSFCKWISSEQKVRSTEESKVAH